MPGVYILLDPETNYLKIGRATDLDQRLANLRTANPRLQLAEWFETPYGSSVEAYLHKRLISYRKEGEFFEVDIEVVKAEFAFASAEMLQRPSQDELDPIEQMTVLTDPRSPSEKDLFLLQELLRIRAEKARLEWQEESILAQIKRNIGSASGITDWATYTPVARKSLDTAALRSAHPDIADAFTRQAISRTLRVQPFIR